jgi:AGZA family xanthine/uracil permease-like MFS transporter
LLERLFHLKENNTNIRIEVVAGITTFITMAYIIFVNPQFLNLFGDPKFANIALPITATATCLASGIITILMGTFTNYPLALASGMGLNAFVAYQLAVPMGSFKPAFGVVILEGVVISILVLTRLRESIMRAIPLPMKHAIGIGIGFLIAFIGLQSGGLIKPNPDTIVTIGNLTTFPVLVVVIGFIITSILMARKVKGAILIGIIISTVIAIIGNYVTGFNPDGTSKIGFLIGSAVMPAKVFSRPDFSTLGYFNFSVFSILGILGACLTIFSIMLSDFFDTMGTVVGIGAQAGFMDETGHIPKLRSVLFIDSLGPVVGGATGASSVTSYIESAAGVSSGGRTGLTTIIVGVLFLLFIFINPVAAVIPPQATAPALIIVGFLMVGLIRTIPFDDIEIAIPAFITILLMPLTYSITNGIGAGFITFTLIKVFRGKFKDIHPLMYIVTLGFIIYFIIPIIQRLSIGA